MQALEECSAKRCPAVARVLASKGNAELAFCHHHANEYEASLKAQGFALIIDPEDGLE